QDGDTIALLDERLSQLRMATTDIQHSAATPRFEQPERGLSLYFEQVSPRATRKPLSVGVGRGFDVRHRSYRRMQDRRYGCVHRYQVPAFSVLATGVSSRDLR